MRDRVHLLLAAIAVVAFILGAALSLGAGRPEQRAVTLTEEAVYPDHSAGHAPGLNRANEVRIRLTLVTRTPWIQGQEQLLDATVEAAPGPGVALVEPVTLFLYLERAASPRRDILTGDLDLLQSAGANRWTPIEGPLDIYPNQDVSGANFFFTFAVSLNVQYANGASYGSGGWGDPNVRIIAPDIVSDLAPLGMGVAAAGFLLGIFAGVPSALPMPRRFAEP